MHTGYSILPFFLLLKLLFVEITCSTCASTAWLLSVAVTHSTCYAGTACDPRGNCAQSGDQSR